MEKITHLFDTEAEWLAFKEGKVGASVIGSIAGLNKYKSAYAIWEQYTNRIPPIEQTITMAFGSLGEPIVMELFKRFVNSDITYLRDRSKILLYQSVEYPWLVVSPDDIAIFEEEEMLVEVKTTNAYNLPDEVPDYIKAQVQLQMLVSGYRKTLLMWFNLINRDVNYMVIEADKDEQDYLLQEAINFKHLVDEDLPPEKTVLSDFSGTSDDSTTIVADDTVFAAYVKLCSLNIQSKIIKEKVEINKLIVAKFLEEKAVLEKDGVKLLTFKTQKRNNVDSKKLKADGLYEKYVTVSENRVMKINYNNLEKLGAD